MIKSKFLKLINFGLFFLIGALLASLLIGVVFILIFSLQYQGRIYPGVKIAGFNYEGYTPTELETALEQKYRLNSQWTFHYQDLSFTEDANSLGLRVATQRISQRAFTIGRNNNITHSVMQIISAYLGGIDLPLDLDWDPGAQSRFYSKLSEKINYPAIEAQFRFDPNLGPDHKGRVVAFVQSKEGVALDQKQLETNIRQTALNSLITNSPANFDTQLATVPVLPTVSSQSVSNMQIVDKLGSGESFFYDSIPGRIYNIQLGTQKISGSLVAPGEEFSFDQAIGTVSAIFGFQKAYAIIKGKTVLDDGGGVCQVSTTLYRAVLNAGLPVTERVAHSYRVGFYEQGGFLPGMDATVYPPDPDFKFKNDTGGWLLIQGFFDPNNSKLTFDIYGKGDGRISQVTKPVILATTPPPDPIYEDDPTLPNGQVKQVDTAHFGANVYFTRTVTRNGATLISEKISTNYIPWPARYLRGTKI